MNDDVLIHRLAADDLANLVIGDFVASGQTRDVYVWRPDPSCVVKVQRFGAPWFQNITEYETWHAARGTPAEKWLAPVCWCSRSGHILVQKRTYPTDKPLPRSIPKFLEDSKRSNWGLWDGRMVCHDYGTASAINNGVRSKATYRPKWREE